MARQLANVTVMVNNEVVLITPGSAKWKEGLGEQKTRVVSGGGGLLGKVYSDDTESKMGRVEFTMPTTIENIKKARQWKLALDENLVQVMASNADGSFTKTFSEAGFVNDYDAEAGSETSITVVFESNPAV